MENTKLLIGEEVFSLLKKEDFQKEWDDLYQNCAWATAFQSRGFVSNWYIHHQDEFLPVLVKSTANGHLTGLLTLTKPLPNTSHAKLRNNRPRIVGAGVYDAEYQTWLGLPEENGFIQAALKKVISHFPSHDIMFRFVPSRTPLDWVASNSYWKNKCVLQPYKRPFMEMNDPEFLKIFKKRGYRLKVNRLKRLGDLHFKRITELEDFVPILDELTTQFDFRQGAMFNKITYKGKVNKANFLIELFKEGLLHATILYLNKEIISSIIAVKDSQWAHLGGINTHSPFYAQHSPGFLHFIMLGEQLVKDQIQVFDLTPGGDAYKERLATNFDQVHELLVTNSKTYFVKRQLRTFIHNQLIKAGKRPMSLELDLKRKVQVLKRQCTNFLKMDKKMDRLKKIGFKDKIQIFALEVPGNTSSFPISIKKDSLKDLLNFQQTGSEPSRWEFLEMAMKKFENGEHCYSCSENEILMACIWTGLPDGIDLKSISEQSNSQSDLYLNGFYIHPNCNIGVQEFLEAVAGEIRGRSILQKLNYVGGSKEGHLFQDLTSKVPLQTY